MQSSSPDPVVNLVNAEVIPATIPGCAFEYDDGSKCLDLKLFARNLCARHYQQLRRIGAFDRKPTADVVDVVSNVNAERLNKARDILERAAPTIARTWIRSAKVAALKGHHKASQDLLTAIDVVKQASKDSPASAPLTINVGVKLAGVK